MPRVARVRSSRSGFTLIEVMVVVLIIAILAALIFSALDYSRQQHKVQQAAAATTAIKAAVQTYHYEHGKWPVPESDLSSTVDRTYSNDNCKVVNILTNATPPMLSTSDYPTDTAGNILDPWRQPYAITIDLDNDGTPPDGVQVTAPR